MRFILLTQYYPPEVGAPQRRLSELASRLVRRGHTIVVLTAMPNYPTGMIHAGYGGFVHRETLNGIPVVRSWIYPTKRADYLHRLANYFSFVASACIVGMWFLPRAEYLLVESPPLFLGMAGFVLSRLKGARMIFNVSDLWPQSAVTLGVLKSTGLAYRLSAWLESFCVRKAWLVSGQSESIVADIRRRFTSAKVRILSNGVDTRAFVPTRTALDTVETSGNGEECVVLYAGLHGLAQGLDQILIAAEKLRTSSRCRFVLVGDGPEKESLVRNASDRRLHNVQFLASQPADAMPRIVASADIVLVPLKMHIPGAVPSKLYEAMACGKPVVLVATGEAAAIVERHRAGLVVQPGDVDGLAHAVRLLAGSAAMRVELGTNGRRAVEQYFDREKIVTQFIEALEASLDSHAASTAGIRA